MMIELDIRLCPLHSGFRKSGRGLATGQVWTGLFNNLLPGPELHSSPGLFNNSYNWPGHYTPTV